MTGDDLVSLWAEESRRSRDDVLVVADVVTVGGG
jgi:hypothetical protein